MSVAARLVMVSLAVLAASAEVGAAAEATAEKQRQIEQLIEVHDLTTSVSIGNFYLKQEGLIAIRGLLTRLGNQDKLGPGWNSRDPQWQRAESVLLKAVVGKSIARLHHAGLAASTMAGT